MTVTDGAVWLEQGLRDQPNQPRRESEGGTGGVEPAVLDGTQTQQREREVCTERTNTTDYKHKHDLRTVICAQ